MNFTSEFNSFFSDNPPVLPKNPDAKTINICGKRVAYSDITSVKKVLTPEVCIKYGLLNWYALVPSEGIGLFLDYVQNYLMPKESTLNYSDPFPNVGLDSDYALQNYIAIRFAGEKRGRESGYSFLDTRTFELSKYDYYSMKNVVGKDAMEAMCANSKVVVEGWDPYEKKILPHDDPSTLKINFYVPPFWKTKAHKPKLPIPFKRLMNHLFVDEISKEYVYNWIYHSLTSRCQTYGYLLASKGSGKGSLANLLMRVHGLEENTSNPSAKTFRKEFNKFAKNKTFLFLDELRARTKDQKDYLKYFINDYIQIEGKGSEAENTVRNHASALITNNALDAIVIEPSDRRFSIPNTSDVPLKEVYGEEWARELNEKIIPYDLEAIGCFASWILEEFKNPKYSSSCVFKGRRFEEVVVNSQVPELRRTIQKVLDGEEDRITYHDEVTSLNTNNRFSSAAYPSFYEWREFFTDFTWKGKKMCRVEDNDIVMLDTNLTDDLDTL